LTREFMESNRLNNDGHDLADLVASARQGDAPALNALLERLRPKIHRLAERRISRSTSVEFDASDLAQQVLSRVAMSLDGFRGEVDGALAGWLRKIVENLAADELRRAQADIRDSRRTVSIEGNLSGITADASSPSQRLSRNEEITRVQAAIERLPLDQANAVRLRHLQQMSITEIAARMQKSELATRQLIFRGMTGLRALLDSDTE
jgi:RNA polymerase sigma-70 factor (ECF subfamily)